MKLDKATGVAYTTHAITEEEAYSCVVSDGHNEQLKVNAGIDEGYGDLTYSWYDSDWNLFAGKNSATYTVENVTKV